MTLESVVLNTDGSQVYLIECLCFQNEESLNMFIPVGNMQHYYPVAFLTFTITIGSAVYILYVMANSAANL